MKQKALHKRPRGRWRWTVTIALVVAAAAITTYGLWLRAPLVTGGTPRLVADRTTIDVGDVPFYRFVNAVFTLTNAGGGVLAIDGWTRVTAAKGC